MATTKELAKEIRKVYKEMGYTRKQVSVRISSASLCSEIQVTVKDPNIELTDQFKKVAMQAEQIRWCEFTGEILSGGNRYVSVKYSYEAEEIRVNRILFPTMIALDEAAQDRGTVQKIMGTKCTLAIEKNDGITLWDKNDRPSFAGYLMEDLEKTARMLGYVVSL